MKSTFFALVSSALVAFTAAYTAPVGDFPQGNPIARPGLDEIVPAKAPYTITWDPTSAGTVTILLLRGPSTNVVPLYPIVEQIPNTGTYVWTPAADLEDDVTHYGIQLIDDATGFYQYSTQFGVSNPVVVSSSSVVEISTTPISSTEVPQTSDYPTSTTAVEASPSSSASSTYITSVLPPVDATTIVHTNTVIITSCAPTVSNCPAHPTPTTTPAPIYVPPPVAPSSIISWSNSTLATTTSKAGSAASTGFGVSTSAVPSPTFPPFANAGERVRSGCALGAILVAAFALAM